MIWRRVQEKLKALGFDPGKIDNEYGPNTRRALMRFQTSRGIVASGHLNNATLNALFGEGVNEEDLDPPWFQEAMKWLGVKEVTGPKSNPIILDWASDAGIPYSGDDIAWCGLFVAFCMSRGCPEEPQPNNQLGAQQWLKFGGKCEPIRGSVLVFWRESPNSWKGHVGFYAGEDAGAYHVLGGNQSDSVSIARIAKSRLLGARWPLNVALYGGRVAMDEAGGLSNKED